MLNIHYWFMFNYLSITDTICGGVSKCINELEKHEKPKDIPENDLQKTWMLVFPIWQNLKEGVQVSQ